MDSVLLFSFLLGLIRFTKDLRECMARSGIHSRCSCAAKRNCCCDARWFEPSRGSQEKSKLRDLLFSIQSEGLACNLTAGEYVIAEGVWHHASACILLRIDYIQHFVLIPYRRQAADFIHAYRRDFASCIFILRAQKHPKTKRSMGCFFTPLDTKTKFL